MKNVAFELRRAQHGNYEKQGCYEKRRMSATKNTIATVIVAS